ncbi:MAG: DUF4114 domain-containing protein [Planctomycetota bacterium]|nr:DUF4114 domain-containing protein [Planctomycetota bacterium]
MRISLIATVLATVALSAVSSEAATVSPVQSSARPLGLKTVGPVMLGGSDGRSKKFMVDALPAMNKTARDRVPEGKNNTPSGRNSINPGVDTSLLKLDYDYNVRAYFVGEGAGYHNSFGFYTSDYDPKKGLKSTDAKLIFPDASSSASYLGSGSGKRSSSEPLLPGDFVQLGKMKSGTQINPFLISDGANGGKDVYTPYASKNPDGIEHFVLMTVTAIPNSPYLLLGIEDLRGGGDKDYNDLVVALDVGVRNVLAITGAAVPAPPAVWGGLVAMGWVVVARIRARRNATQEAVAA